MSLFSRKIFLAIPAIFIMNSCSVYKSAVRKDFEEKSEGKVSLSSVQSVCQEMNPLAAWIEKEFPGGMYELIVSEPELEVWKRTLDDGTVEVRIFQIQNTKTTECLHHFLSENQWEKFGPEFLDEVTAPLD